MIPDKLERLLARTQKPARYCGGEPGSVTKDASKVDIRVAFCFPDMYEVGMSHLGIKILYGLFNTREDCWCERVFAPDEDLRAMLLEEHIPLYGLESLSPMTDFDIIAFTIQYELCYTTILDMLYLGGIPLRAVEREGLEHIVVGGGPCTCNAEPLADFFDIFFLGEGEEMDMELLDLYKQAKRDGLSRKAFLRRAAQIPGVYVPSLYTVDYHPDGTVAAISPRDGAPATVRKRIVRDFDKAYYPDSFVVPFIDVIHDRVSVEVMRGCIRGCRFCQAGYIYRPKRERSAETLDAQAHTLCGATGYNEVSLLSLSTSDHSGLEPMLERMLSWTEKDKVNLALPSLRIDNFSPKLLELVSKVRKSGLTFAPEAGSQRMRDVINKNITEQEVMDTCASAFAGGYCAVKLYFMLGLPTETMEDISAIDALAREVVNLFYRMPDRPKGKGINVTVSAAAFVPKPFTPFQFEPQDSLESFAEKQHHLITNAGSKKIRINYHDAKTSRIEAVLARGDRRLCAAVEAVWRAGGRLEAWEEHFRYGRWTDALETLGLDADFYACRRRPYDEILPWEHMDVGVSKAFLIRENELAHAGKTTANCAEKCAGCGASGLTQGDAVLCVCPKKGGRADD